MVTFLDFPQPVRARIYAHVLTSHLEPVKDIEELREREQEQKIQRILRHGSDAAEIAIERCIRYPFVVYLSFTGLLRTNPQCRREARDVMRSMKKDKKVHYKLDALIENEVSMLPVWLKCPVRTMEINRLDIDIRLFGFADEDAKIDGLIQHGRDRCRTLAFAIVALVARFIERGPRFEHLRQGEIRIRSLLLNFRSREEDLQPHQQQLGRSNSIDEEKGLLDHLTMAALHDHDDHKRNDSVQDSDSVRSLPKDGGRDPDEVVNAEDLLRTVDLVLRPLWRSEEYMADRRQRHFSAGHLAFLRRNVGKISLLQDGALKKRMSVGM